MTAQQSNLEKNQATIVCLDIFGVIESTHQDNIEKSAQLLQTCNEIIESVTGYYGGVIYQFNGKNAVIGFVENPEKPVKSNLPLDTILEIQQKIQVFSTESGLNPKLEIEAGIHSGLVLTGKIGTSGKAKETVMGDAVDIASKIKEMANKGQILVGPEIFKQNEKQFDFQTLEPVFIKGKPEPLSLYKLLQKRKKEFKPQDQARRSIFSEMVGRETEKEKLKHSLISLTKGKGGILNIVGEPGTGKSRLIAEIKKERIFKQLVWYEGRALSHGHNLSYHPIAGIIKSWAGIHEQDKTSTVENKLKNAIQNIQPEAVDSSFPFIARFMGFALSQKANERISSINPDTLDKMMLKALRELLIKASKINPFVLAIEDLHWADNSSLELLKSLFMLSYKHPILFVNIMRPGYEDTSEPLINLLETSHSEKLDTVNISNLDLNHSKELINNLILSGQLPDSFLQTLISKTDGNPFFIEEVLRSLIDQGIIEFKEKTFEVSENIQSINIPETINEVLLSRVEKLDEKTRSLLDTASVIGRNFYFKVLDEAAETIDEVSERLSYLKNMQLIQESDDKENLEFVFKHALAHQAAYDSMMENRRKSLHIKIAESIEKVFPERINEFYGTLAMHYSKAEHFKKAEEYLVKAGDEAFASAAATEAIDFYKEALNVYLKTSGDEPIAERVTMFYEKIAHAFQLGGKNKNAIEYYEKVLRFYGRFIPDSKIRLVKGLVLNIVLMLWTIKFPKTRFKRKATEKDLQISDILFDYCKALATFDSRRWILESILMFKHSSRFSFESNRNAPSLIAAYSITFSWTGISLKLAKKLIEIGREGKEEISDAAKFEIEEYAKMHQFYEGDWREDQFMEAYASDAMKRGDLFNLTSYLLFCGFITIELGLEAETYQIINRMKDIGVDFEGDYSMAQYYRLKAFADYKYRKFDQLIVEADNAIDYTRKTGHLAMLQIIFCMRAITLAGMNDLKGAESDLKEIREIAPKQKRVKIWHSTYLITRAYVLTEELRRNQNNKTIRKELMKVCKSAIRHSRFVPNNLIESHRLMGNALWMMGKKKKAIRHYLKSIKEAERVNGKLELSRTYFELGKRIFSNGISQVDGISGEEYLEKAKVLFIEMNLEYDFKELERFEKN